MRELDGKRQTSFLLTPTCVTTLARHNSSSVFSHSQIVQLTRRLAHAQANRRHHIRPSRDHRLQATFNNHILPTSTVRHPQQQPAASYPPAISSSWPSRLDITRGGTRPGRRHRLELTGALSELGLQGGR